MTWPDLQAAGRSGPRIILANTLRSGTQLHVDCQYEAGRLQLQLYLTWRRLSASEEPPFAVLYGEDIRVVYSIDGSWRSAQDWKPGGWTSERASAFAPESPAADILSHLKRGATDIAVSIDSLPSSFRTEGFREAFKPVEEECG